MLLTTPQAPHLTSTITLAVPWRCYPDVQGDRGTESVSSVSKDTQWTHVTQWPHMLQPCPENSVRAACPVLSGDDSSCSWRRGRIPSRAGAGLQVRRQEGGGRKPRPRAGVGAFLVDQRETLQGWGSAQPLLLAPPPALQKRKCRPRARPSLPKVTQPRRGQGGGRNPDSRQDRASPGSARGRGKAQVVASKTFS